MYLHRCFDSFRAQRYKDIELMVSDNGSTDEIGAIFGGLWCGYITQWFGTEQATECGPASLQWRIRVAR